MSTLLRCLATSSTLLLISCMTHAGAQTASPSKPVPPVLAAWTELVGDVHAAPDPKPTGHTVVRVITSAKSCPTATADGHPLSFTVRQVASQAFPVTTCQATPPASARHITVAGITLATEPVRLQRIIVIGDTGCRLKGPLVQDCNDPKRWPFPLVAARAAARHPDLVIHVGDYYYRESPCPAGAPGCAGSPHGDAWPAWNADLFTPVAPLLTAAPWIFVRGNHEQCGRGADGWFRFIDAAPMPQRCEDDITAPPFTVRLDGLTLNVMDSADTDDVNAPANLVALFNKQFEQLGSAVETGHGWILTHRPIWGLDPKVVGKPRPGKEAAAESEGMAPLLPGFNAVDFPSNRTEQVASDNRKLTGTDMVLSGHVHLFTTLSFGESRPAQLVVGNGGDNPNVAVAGPAIRTETIDDMPAKIHQLQRYGYFMMDRTKDGWSGTAFSVDDEVLGQCSFVGREASCLLSPTLPPQLSPSATQ
jgi:Calcineurin-like phosphoesterase